MGEDAVIKIAGVGNNSFASKCVATQFSWEDERIIGGALNGDILMLEDWEVGREEEVRYFSGDAEFLLVSTKH